MDDIAVKRKSIFFNNLILLGLDRSGFEKKHGISFYKDMFVLPNKKGYEVITHFLFSKLSAVTNKDYNLPWPLISKELDRDFQKSCYSHLSSFAQENVVMFPRIVPSVLCTFGGDRFYEVYLAFSSYVLSKTMSNKKYTFLSRPVVTKENFPAAMEILQLSTVISMQRLKESQSVAYANHLIWLKCTKNLSECLEKLKNMLETNKHLLKEKSNILGSLFSVAPKENLKFETVIQKICDYYKPLQEIMKKLDHFLSSEAKLWQYLVTDIGKQNESYILDGHSYNICVTDEMLKNYLSEIEKTCFSTSEENGKLSVLRFIKLLHAFLKYIFDILLKANLSELHESCLITDPSSHSDVLFHVENLVKKLNDEIPDLEQSIVNLKLISGFSELNSHSNTSARHFFPSLPALSFDPEALKGRVPHFNPGELFELSLPDSKKPDGIPTDYLSVSEKRCPEKFNLINLTNVPRDVETCSNAEGYVEMTPYTKSLLMDMTKTDLFLTELNSKIEVPIEKTPLATQCISISDLDDLTFDPTPGFRMSESLLLEQSFNSVALPDMSLDD